MKKPSHEMTEEEYAVWHKQIRMANILASPFHYFNHIGLNSDLGEKMKMHIEYTHQQGDITMQDLAEFYLQVGACIFSPQKENEEADDE